MSNESNITQPPLDFCWGTFCQGVLTENDSKTLYSVLPGFRIVGEPIDPDPAKPTAIEFGKLAVFAVFRRRDVGSDTPIKTYIQISSTEENFTTQSVEVNLAPMHTHFQLVFYVDNLKILAPTTLGKHVLKPTIEMSCGGVSLGNVDIIVIIDNVSNTEEKQEKLGKGGG